MRKPGLLESGLHCFAFHGATATPSLAWAAYRLILGVVGLAWVCLATTLCGCNYGNAWMTNRSGVAYYRQGNYDAARFEFERALVNNPYRADYAFNVAKSMQMQGDTAGAEQMYQYALTLDPGHELSYHGLAEQLIEEGREEDAAKLVQAWADTQPYLPEANMELARWQQQRGDFASARQSMGRAVSLNPHDPVLLSQMGYLYEQSNEPALAAAYYQQSLMLKPNQPEVKTRLSNVGWLPGDTPALTMARRVSIMDPTMNGGVTLAGGPGRQFGQSFGATGPMITPAVSWQSSPQMTMPMQGQRSPNPMTGQPMMGQPMMASPMMASPVMGPMYGPSPMQPQISMPLNYDTSYTGSPEMTAYSPTTMMGPTTAYAPGMEQGTWTSSTPSNMSYGTPGLPMMSAQPTSNYSSMFTPAGPMSSQPVPISSGLAPAMGMSMEGQPVEATNVYSPAPQMATTPSVQAF